jgi:LysM repeat protein
MIEHPLGENHILMRRLIVFALILAIASLACSLTSSSDEPTVVVRTSFSIPTATATLSSGIGRIPTSTSTAVNSSGNTTYPTPCSIRTDWLTYGVISGDTLSSIAVRSGTTTDALFAANCLGNADQLSVGQILRVPAIPSPLVTNTPIPSCLVNWFFSFDAGQSDPLNACPDSLYTVQAIGQDFEGGRVYRYAALPGSSDTRGTIYVVFNTGTWITFPDTWDSSQPSTDPTLSPPPGLQAPTGAILKVWKDNPEIRTTLGWAYEPATAFVGRVQNPFLTTGQAFPNNNAYWYIDHGKWGVVLRMVSVNSGPNTWEVVGHY